MKRNLKVEDPRW